MVLYLGSRGRVRGLDLVNVIPLVVFLFGALVFFLGALFFFVGVVFNLHVG